MELKKRNELIEEFFYKRCLKVLKGKGEDSSIGTDDANRNFKEEVLGDKIDALDVWFIYFIKHVSRLKKYIINRKNLSEGIVSTVIDITNYAFILLTLLIDLEIIKEEDLNLKNIKIDLDK